LTSTIPSAWSPSVIPLGSTVWFRRFSCSRASSRRSSSWSCWFSRGRSSMIEPISFPEPKGTHVYGTKVSLQTFARLQREGVRNALGTGAARYRGCRVISGESRDGYPALGRLRRSLRGRFTEQYPRVVIGLKQSLSGRRETRPCLSSRSVGRYIAPEHRAVFAKLPHERGQPEVVVMPGLECESVEFSLVQVGPTQKSDPPRNSPLGLQYCVATCSGRSNASRGAAPHARSALVVSKGRSSLGCLATWGFRAHGQTVT
jgi:hypothetical protein